MSSETPIDFGPLLPAADQSVHCNHWAIHLDVNPAGTAIAAQQVLLIEVPLPWPKPISEHQMLHDVMPLAMQGAVPTKMLASVPRGYTPGVRVTSYDRTDAGTRRRVFEIADPADLKDVVAALVEVPGSGQAPPPLDETDAPQQAVLVCTQGSHDICCGSEGTRFALDVEEAFPDVEVHRVSHTGGHRFAPTAMTFPDGRMWAWLNLPLMGRILDRSATRDELAKHGRGWWGADMGFAQVAEHAMFEEHGWEWAQRAHHVEVHQAEDLQRAQCTVVSGDDALQVEVEIARAVPTIACRALGGLPAKPGRDYRISGNA